MRTTHLGLLTLGVIFLGAAVPAPAPVAAVDPATFSITKYVNAFAQERSEKTAAGYQFWFVDKNLADGKTVKLSVVGPHLASHAPHRHPEDEVFVVLEGQAEFFLNGQTRAVGPLTSMYAPSNVEHGIRNLGDTDLKYLVIKKQAVTP
jgi:quercetin dioxygenase-like cupin family protein